jgi:hypothetical protein
LGIKFAVAHRCDQNVDDQGDPVERWYDDAVLTFLKLNRFPSPPNKTGEQLVFDGDAKEFRVE